MPKEASIEAKIRLPVPDQKAYFPQSGTSEILANEALRRAGSNLVYAIEYGSHVAGDATPTSMVDMVIIVEDTRQFHQRNMDLARDDYGPPHWVDWHDWLNKFGFNFYYTRVSHGDRSIRTKYAVISRENFIRGCHGSLAEKEEEKKGAFGMYVAGRMQKVALRPLFKTENWEKVSQVEEAINAARLDGIWLSLGFLEDKFSLDELLTTYVYLSYRADLRVEKPGKIQEMIRRNRSDYEEMLAPLLAEFSQMGIIQPAEEGGWRKVQFPSHQEVEKRMQELKIRAALTNYIKNPLTVGIGRGISYALAKLQRSREAAKHEDITSAEDGQVQKSNLRRISEAPLKKIGEINPLTANQTTLLGLGLAVAASVIGNRETKDPATKRKLEIAGAFLLLASYAADFIDGPTAVAKGTAGKGIGAYLDTGVDRLSDAAAGIVPLQKAQGREKFGWLCYLALHSLPSFLRSLGVEAGQKVPELNPGSRVSRSTLIFTRQVAPQRFKELLLWATNAAILLGCFQRYQIIRSSGNKEVLDKTHKQVLAHVGSFIAAHQSRIPFSHLLWELGTTAMAIVNKKIEVDNNKSRAKK